MTTPQTDLSAMKPQELATHLVATRAKLAANLDALEDKVNVPKRLGRASRKFGRRVQTLRRENPLLLAGVAVGVAAAIGATVFLVVKISARR